MTPDPISLPEDLASAIALAGDRLGVFGRRILWYPEIGSTNDAAGALANRGAQEGVVVAADQQTAGRGRLGRTWISPRGAGLYFSTVLRPSASASALLTIAAGVAVAEGIASGSGLQVELKWPNDVHVGGRKLAGILAEGAPRHVVLGIGINVLPAAYPPDVACRATSIETELGRPVDRGVLLAECLAALATHYRELHDAGGHGVIRAWRGRAASSLGRPVEWDEGGERRHGRADGLDEDGTLVVRSGGGLVRIRSGEVRWL